MEESQVEAPKGKKGKKGGKNTIRVAKMLARALWNLEWKAANPQGTVKERAAAWKAVRAERLASETKPLNRALQMVRRMGVEFTIIDLAAKNEGAEDEIEVEDEDDEDE